MPSFELEAAYLHVRDRATEEISLQTPILPETYITPAVSVGIWDVGNETTAYSDAGYHGRAYYLSMSKSLLTPSGRHYLIQDIAFTAGLGAGSIHGGFGSASAVFPLGVRTTLEFDSRSLNSRVSLPLLKQGGLSLSRIAGHTFLGIEIHSTTAL